MSPLIFNYRKWLKAIKPSLPAIISCVVVIVSITAIGYSFYSRGKMIMQDQLKDKLRSTAAAAAMQFDGETMIKIRSADTMDSSEELRQTVKKLQAIHEKISSVHHAYILRKTEDPQFLEFVADADLGYTDEELDENKNGMVDEDEVASYTGELYDWSEFPVLGNEAFLRPSVDDVIGTDQWGSIISGYAPIRDEKGQSVAVLGIDMKADEYTALATSIFSPVAFLLFICAVISITTAITFILWHRRLDILNRLEVERNGLLRLAFHQLGGPLTIINWSLEELEEDGPASIQRSIMNIHEGVSRLSEILKTLKSADLVHAGKIQYKPELMSLATVLEQVTRESANKLAARKQRVVLDLEQDITMKLDAKLIAGVMRELLSNAIDFSQDSSSITVRSRKIGRSAEFSVIDRGCGIPKSDMKRIFDEFSRGSNATRYKADGNGLGLYIVQGIIEQAGGNVRITSEEGKGTTATVALPIV